MRCKLLIYILFTSITTSLVTTVGTGGFMEEGTNSQTMLVAKVGGNADFEGANVAAKSLKMKVEGKTTILNAYDETTHEERSNVDNKDEALFGLFKDNNGKESHSKAFDKKATGNSWKVEDSFEVIGKGDVTTQGIELDAHQFKIESTKGNVYDKAAEEVHEEEKEVDKYSLRQGLLTGKKDDLQWKGEEGRASIKLREKKEKKTQTKEEKHTGKSSSFKTHAKIVKTADGKEEIVHGHGMFKAAKKVVLEATEADIQGKLSLQGEEGVSILAKKETEKREGHQETYTEELSLGIKNSIVAAAYQGKVVLDALKAEEEAIRAYSNYKEQLKEAKALYENGIITQEDYQAVQEEEKFHLMATAAATLAVSSRTKQFLSSTASAIKTAGATAGFSIDLQADIRKTVDQVMSLLEQEKRLAKKEAGEPIYEYCLPVLGSFLESGDAIVEGDPAKAARLAGLGLLEALPSAIVTGLGIMAKGARWLAKPGVQTTLHGAERIAEAAATRGVGMATALQVLANTHNGTKSFTESLLVWEQRLYVTALHAA